MTASETASLLERHGIKPTANRIIVAGALADEKRPLSIIELEDAIGSIDKSGIFRAIMLFKEHHLVHVIEDGSDSIRYELCQSHDKDHDDDQHVHFFCEKCRKTYCLDGLAIPEVKLPERYTPRSVTYLVKGICPDCAGK